MKYIKLPFVTNTYPQTQNYKTTGDSKATLFGLYSDVNKVDFTIPDIKQIKVVNETSFRNVIAIYKDTSDNSPKFYTSEIFDRDIQASIIESNPYLVNYSLLPSSIIKIYLKDIIENIKSFREDELKIGVSFIRNNFILYDESGVTKVEDTSVSQYSSSQTIVNQEVQNQLSQLVDKIQKFESGLLNADTNMELKRGLFYGPNKRKAVLTIDGETFESSRENWNNTTAQRNEIKQKVGERLSQLKSQKTELENKLTSTIKNTFEVKTSQPKLILNPNKIDTDIKKLLGDVIGAKDESDITEVNGIFIDCIHLIRYIDWILTPPKMNDIDTNGVIPADKLSVFKTQGEIPAQVKENPKDESGTKTGGKRYNTYRIIRLSIPASMADSLMTFKDQYGNSQQVQTDKYGVVGEYCAEEDSWEGNRNVYQMMLLGPCSTDNNNVSNPRGGGRGPGRGGNYDYLREQSGNTNYIDYNRDNRAIE